MIGMKVERLDMDMISMLPGSIIEMILTLMSIRDTVRTSVLSRRWRYNWTNIPKLVFDDKFFEGSSQREILYAIYQVLLLHRGPILEFTLNMSKVAKRFEIDQIILHLSRNHSTLKKLTLNGFKPSSLYSSWWFMHLNLVCGLRSPSTFNGFGMLPTIYLDCIELTVEMLLRLVSGCPLLKSFTLLQFEVISADGDDSSIVQLFECLPMVEHLHLDFSNFLWFVPGEVPIKLPTSLVHLKYLHLSKCILGEESKYYLALLLIRCSPYSEKIKIEIYDELDPDEGIVVFLELQDYSDVWLDHLRELEIERFANILPKSEILKLILIKSPMLKKVRIKLDYTVESDEENKIVKSTLQLPRASPVVEIIVEKD